MCVLAFSVITELQPDLHLKLRRFEAGIWILWLIVCMTPLRQIGTVPLLPYTIYFSTADLQTNAPTLPCITDILPRSWNTLLFFTKSFSVSKNSLVRKPILAYQTNWVQTLLRNVNQIKRYCHLGMWCILSKANSFTS